MFFAYAWHCIFINVWVWRTQTSRVLQVSQLPCSACQLCVMLLKKGEFTPWTFYDVGYPLESKCDGFVYTDHFLPQLPRTATQKTWMREWIQIWHSDLTALIRGQFFPLVIKWTHVLIFFKVFFTLWTRSCVRTRNCSKLRKIYSGPGPISLMIIPSKFVKEIGPWPECIFCEQFVLLWFKFLIVSRRVEGVIFYLSQSAMLWQLGITTPRLTSHSELIVHAGCGATH